MTLLYPRIFIKTCIDIFDFKQFETRHPLTSHLSYMYNYSLVLLVITVGHDPAVLQRL